MATVMKTRVSGTWQTIDVIKVRVSGTWQTIDEGKVRVSGVWQRFHGCTLTTASLSSTSVSHTTDFTTYAQTQYNTNGVEYQNTGGTNNYNTSRGNWLDSGDACGGWIDHTLNSGSALYSRAQTPGTRAQMTSNRNYRQRDTNSSSSSVTSNISVKMYNAQTGGTLKSTGTYSLTANYFNSCPTCCFTPDTLITMACGMQIPISQIRVGDEIVVYKPDREQQESMFDTEVVEQIITRIKRRMYRITFEDGTVLHCSDDHPLDVKGTPKSVEPQEEYKYTWKTDTLKVGDFVTCIKAQWWGAESAKVTKIEYAEYEDMVYTLGNSYFFANGKLVY